MRGIALLIVVAVALPYCFFEPRFGILMWLWFGLMNAHRLTWGVLEAPYPLVVAMATIGGTLIGGKARKFPLQRETCLLLFLWTIFTLTSLAALEPEDAWRKWGEVSKIFLMVFVSLCLDWNRQWIKYMTGVIAFSIGFIGIKGAVFSLLTGGKHMILGPPGFLAANTSIAIALDMTIPLFLILARDETTSRRFKLICYLTAAATSLSALLTYSRGGMLGLLVVAGLLLMKSRYKVLAALMAVMALLFTLWFLPEQWFKRMGTLEKPGEDMSAMERMVTWKILWQFALDHPITGGGFLLYSPKISDEYIPQALALHEMRRWKGVGASAHSIWLAVLAEHGFIALFFYGMLFVSVFISLGSLKRATRGHPSLGWIESYASLLSVSFCSFLVAGSFLDVAYFDLVFQLIGLLVILKNLAQQELAVGVARVRIPAGYPNLSPVGAVAGRQRGPVM